jgi:hypothetical protein
MPEILKWHKRLHNHKRQDKSLELWLNSVNLRVEQDNKNALNLSIIERSNP